MRALVTGASGFIGTFLCDALVRGGWSVRAASRRPLAVSSGQPVVVAPDYRDLGRQLEGVDVVFHSAGGAHDGRAAEASLMDANAQLTARVAAASDAAGVSRFIFISTIKVQGEERSEPYREDEAPHPHGPYAVSKLKAEEALRTLPLRSRMSWTIIRPPLVYGPGVGSNFLQLLEFIDRGRRIPVPAMENRRSFISVRNLCSALMAVAITGTAANETFLVSDGTDFSTEGLVRKLAEGLGREPRLLRVPSMVVRAAMLAPYVGGRARRLLGSLQADISQLKSQGWVPPLAAAEELLETARWYRGTRR